MDNIEIQGIFDRINKEHPCYGSINITIIFHEDHFVRYDYGVNEIHIVKEDVNNGKK